MSTSIQSNIRSLCCSIRLEYFYNKNKLLLLIQLFYLLSRRSVLFFYKKNILIFCIFYFSMKTKIAIVVGLLFVSSFASFNFNADDCKAEKFDNWDSLYCPCSGGSGDYEYQFTKLPPGWYANKDRILIPRGRV